jgi:hypothetical protein
MLSAVIEAAILIVLLKALSGEDISFGGACLIAFVSSVATTLLAMALTLAMGPAGFFVAALIAAAVLGAVLSALFGVEIKRACVIGGIFTVVHIAIGIGLSLIFA